MHDGLEQHEDAAVYIGCCGAYCYTCRPFRDGLWKGCKLGYAEGSRELRRAKCRIKICCLTRELKTCADCPELDACIIIGRFFGKNGHKYRKYRESIQFIVACGYSAFLSQTVSWKGAYGPLGRPEA